MLEKQDNILSKTRAEDYGPDIWGKFYIPHYFKDMALKNATKSTYIVGKRGCGKTMLLKYLDYRTSFSPSRKSIPSSEISHVGIYWRVDTQFCNSLHHRGIGIDEWTQVFDSYFSLVISVEIIRSLRHIAKSQFQGFDDHVFSKIRLENISDFGDEYPSNLRGLEKILETKRRQFSSWISNISLIDRPVLPAGRTFVDSIIEELKQIPELESVAFYVYLDEVENLVPYQRHLLNSYLKHSQKPFIVSFTSKEFSEDTETTGPESINATHDFNLITLDDLSTEEEKRLFFAEVFLANLDLDSEGDSQLLKLLRNMDQIEHRQSESHADEVLSSIRKKFPSGKLKDFCDQAVGRDRIYRKLKDRVAKAIRTSESSGNISFNDFEALVGRSSSLLILPALLNRKGNDPRKLLGEYKLFKNEKPSNLEGWLHNNLFGALLEAYRPYGAVCPIYSGFDTYFMMANNNLRHFLILCYKAREFAELTDGNVDSIGLDMQARAAYGASEKLIKEIKTFGPHGEQLRTFVLRLGNVFRGFQSLPPMSEPEQNQFTINSGDALSDQEAKFLSEAKKYGIISEQIGNKTKSALGRDIVDYLLNPIYAPYFQISYRRKRKIQLSVENFRTLSSGTEDEYNGFFSQIVVTEKHKSQQSELW